MIDPSFNQVVWATFVYINQLFPETHLHQMGTDGSPWIYMKKNKQLVTQSNLFTNQNLFIISLVNDVMNHKFENQNNANDVMNHKFENQNNGII